MLATALLSAFISNTATTAMMLPIGLSVISILLKSENKPDNAKNHKLATCTMLSIACAASIGEISTVTGTAPNLFVVSFIKDAIDSPYLQDISFLEWSKIGVSVVIILLPVCWWLLTKVIYKVDKIKLNHSLSSLKKESRSLGSFNYEEKVVSCVFIFTNLLWLSRTYLQGLEFSLGGHDIRPLA